MITAQIEKYLSKRNSDNHELSWEEKQKICTCLVRKGFPYESVRNALAIVEVEQNR